MNSQFGLLTVLLLITKYLQYHDICTTMMAI